MNSPAVSGKPDTNGEFPEAVALSAHINLAF